jgi:hypothetical protein
VPANQLCDSQRGCGWSHSAVQHLSGQ